MADRTPPLGVEELHALVAAGDIDTVVLAFPDMQGRLQGKRFAARFFLDEVLEHGTEGCNYLLAVDADMNTVDGYAMSSWDRGYGDFAMRADPATLRRLPWNEGTAMAVADLAWEDGSPVLAAPRQILRRQLERLAGHGYTAQVGTELEFIVFRDTYEHAWDANYRGLTPANQYNVDYSVLGTGRVEPLLRRIRNEMAGAGLTVESAKGECNPGQHEIAFRYDEALVTCDQHAVYKTGAKEIAAQEGMSLTFMAKYNELEGNSCHIHLSLADADGRNAMAEGGGMSDVMRHFLAGQLVALREFSLLYAPHINSYKRFQPGSFAPTAVAWGHDNRTCALRVVGHGRSLRFENRLPGGDVNPYLAVAGLVAAGLHGIEQRLELPEPCPGNAYTADFAHVPTTLREAAELWENSTLAKAAFGDEVVAHYRNMARVELDAFDAAVTDWELRRSFERM
ncbi:MULTISPECIES: gamma-glutamylethanolamide synthetase GlnA4 [Streptomyces]|uniref:Gamma-glutamylethanolamide synthetase GlnA4 n=2 Tax=Streptomyces violaceoruber group TaxID=2867121 RepID=A0ABT4P8R2_9ACTN|nr:MULTISPECIES: gamma-glutamylethanolamide synthetase GlnA4 [Streptomyces]MYU41135.1 glutamine synthetase [Streptomyces sp. SID7813]MCW8117364.1 gamma-glutamylethanolamide synthetase GlnA4 [Streptomyces anthocyanicus]MCZ4637530.1 gamma-glutamylethanolamide synthetase GlnA4 [Streptomyces rubrogriseus]MDX2928433.1 gamma-glutamylethanolamide synthetase GlnA4 [Streptomyces sp. NRRL_B-16638]MDX3345217.1 gamma-glutamylethanolamide synthetase GlnA4 [Streptomyces sp. ME02-6979A]